MQQPWQGQEAGVGGPIGPLREWIIDLYAPYVLVRCAGFTNDRSQALMIGAYTLVTTCLMADRLDHLGQIGISVDVVVEVVGPDVIGGDADASSRRGGELLIPDERMQNVAEALNLLERPLREAVVLRHLGGLSEDGMARALNLPATEVTARITRGERGLARYLSEFSPAVAGIRPRDARSLLARFEAGLDMQWMHEVRDGAIGYLARCHGRANARTVRWPQN